MFIILIAHTPGNAFNNWIPAKFGFSDATEIFVFCSGMASAIAFGRTFDRAGWGLGTARVAYRVWQVYWAHIGLFFATLAITIVLTDSGLGWRNYWGQLNLWPVIVEGEKWTNDTIIRSLFTLTYVPNYFDILPMYLVVLAMMPLVMALSKVSLWAVFAFVGGTWLVAQTAWLAWVGIDFDLNLPAEPWTDRKWFFNPFGWQLVFFTGFAFMRGWIPAPPVKLWLVALALVIVAVNVPLSESGVTKFGLEWVRDFRSNAQAFIGKSDFGILRYVHFLAMAYLAWIAAGSGGRFLIATGTGPLSRLWDGFVATVMKVGQQSLAVFVFSMAFARIMGFTLDVLEREPVNIWMVNLIGFAMLILVAHTTAYFKSQPWRTKP